jgi:3,5-epimerase/4-reductase
MTRYLVYGSQGWIGKMVTKYMDDNKINYLTGKSRVDNVEELEKEIETVKPTHIVCLIGRTHGVIDGKVYPTIDYLEQEGKLKENVRDNLFSPLVLAILCTKKNIHLTYLGTGCIFSNNLNENEILFTESDLPNFFDSSYSTVKGFTDRLMHLFQDSVLNLRIRMPIVAEPGPRNFITKITSYEKICSMPNSMTVLDELIPVAIEIAEKGKTGTVNLVNPGVISHNEILEMYKEIVDPSFTWKNFTYEEQMKVIAVGRSNNHLDTTLLETESKVSSIHEAVKTTLNKYKTYL